MMKQLGNVIYGLMAVYVALECILYPRYLIANETELVFGLLGLLVLAILMERGAAADKIIDQSMDSERGEKLSANFLGGWMIAVGIPVFGMTLATVFLHTQEYGMANILMETDMGNSIKYISLVIMAALSARVLARGWWLIWYDRKVA